MNEFDQKMADRVEQCLISHSSMVRGLPGIERELSRKVLLRQIIDSVHRVKYVQIIGGQVAVKGRYFKVSDERLDPTSHIFDPLKGAVLEASRGAFDNACWLVFLATHFGKHLVSGWELTRSFYGRLEAGSVWDWQAASSQTDHMLEWLTENESELRLRGKFSNHRRYLSMSATSRAGTGAAMRSYIEWVKGHGSHKGLINDVHRAKGQHPREGFAELYRRMGVVASFGRLGRFDYLTMIGKLGLFPIEPDSVYLSGATGPLSGAKLLYGEPKASWSTLQGYLEELEQELGLAFGMQVLEDALCNWQKSPEKYEYFNG